MGEPAAVLFDVDGTLVDSNYLHARAWHRAFREAGTVVPTWRIHRAIGMDGGTLIETLAGDLDKDAADHADDLHSRFYLDSADELTLLPGAREILSDLHGRGLRVLLATSAPPDELAKLRELLDSEDVLYAVTGGEDVDTAKPDPTIVQIALDRAGVPPERAVFVGDTVWDVRACTALDVPIIGVLSGGISRGELEDEGAAFVCDDVAQLLREVDKSPIARLF
ncbi:HAD superfamily hydrolase (TIGR01509 family)/HAD superfamily hydrolase (TIGR01549 family) [Nocardia tenerifensis]|uniref:HAD superfamily hydrolase (TIGR01509 family)/HAD superfamily hydrolase (TIGR01549 family) n=1 Tax=Nocardia tenerifensis TaxID=228006 RepID=A0A318K240_9NOCA|nr:HAD family hydrolase [Nocardia tenerifensis]PXX65341.1 HAD superfamily hydrolase (TIGR01509 family)/HAD superfamily hydrolase (TIGR01549 family) [Nocardia tenerifensis]